MKFIKKLIQNKRKKKEVSIIITGCVRSGTTLALRVFCPNIKKKDVVAGSKINEPQPMSNLIVFGKKDEALGAFSKIRNEYGIVKSPHIAFIMDKISPRQKVIVTFRDFRLIVPSMMQKYTTNKLELSKNPYWINYTTKKIPDDKFLKAVMSTELFYKKILEFKGGVEIWNYGFWNEWRVRNKNTANLYEQKGETSKNIIDEVRKEDALFSNKQFSIEVWNKFCEENNITELQKKELIDAQKRTINLYASKGYSLKTLDNLN